MAKMLMFCGVLAVMMAAAGCKCACKEQTACPMPPRVAQVKTPIAP